MTTRDTLLQAQAISARCAQGNWGQMNINYFAFDPLLVAPAFRRLQIGR